MTADNPLNIQKDNYDTIYHLIFYYLCSSIFYF